MYNKKAYA